MKCVLWFVQIFVHHAELERILLDAKMRNGKYDTNELNGTSYINEYNIFCMYKISSVYTWAVWCMTHSMECCFDFLSTEPKVESRPVEKMKF